jgi:hypothetical protein
MGERIEYKRSLLYPLVCHIDKSVAAPERMVNRNDASRDARRVSILAPSTFAHIADPESTASLN